MASEEQFAAFATAALPRLLRFGYALTGSTAAAEDLVQTALARSLRAWRHGRIDDPHAFVRKVMVNTSATWHHQRSRRKPLSDLPGPPASTDPSRRVDDRDAIWRALLTLPARQRAVIVLRYYEDLSEAEIAAVMGTTTGTVKSQAARALRRLAGLLDPDLAARTSERSARD